MRIARLYIDRSLKTGDEFLLQKEQTHYISSVLRLRYGDQLCLFNNENAEYLAKIIALEKKSAKLKIEEKQLCQRESNLHTTLGIGLSRGQHMDYAIQKAVELGANILVPLLTEFSNVKVSEDRVENKLQHWQKIIINAAEQCGRTCLPELLAPRAINDFIQYNKSDLKLMFNPEAKLTISHINMQPQYVSLLLGPEGGFSQTEIELATQHDYQSVSLGPRILRAETAVVSALTACQNYWGDLN